MFGHPPNTLLCQQIDREASQPDQTSPLHNRRLARIMEDIVWLFQVRDNLQLCGSVAADRFWRIFEHQTRNKNYSEAVDENCGSCE